MNEELLSTKWEEKVTVLTANFSHPLGTLPEGEGKKKVCLSTKYP
jgi:hypothetical protein